MRHDLRPQHIKGNVFVIAAGDHDYLLAERPQPRDGTGGTGGNGVIIIPHALIGSYQLDAVLHTAEFPGKGLDDLVRHQAVHGGDGRHIILHIVYAGELDVPRGHHDALMTAAAADNVLAPQEHAVGNLTLPAEEAGVAGRAGGLLCCDGIIRIKNGNVLPTLMGKNILLGRHILRHVPVHIQMVGRQIGDDRNVRTLRHGHQLEAGQLQHRKIRAQHSVRLAQQRVADVAAHPHTLSGLFQQLGNDGGGRRLAVRAGDSDDRTRADQEENLHFTGQNGTFLNTGRYLRHIRAQPRCAEDHVRVQVLQIVRAQM